MRLARYSLGIGDRFAHQGKAQLEAFALAAAAGVAVTPVWNKSVREHTITGSVPQSVRDEADAAVRALRWEGQYLVDADHVGLGTVDPFLPSSDFYTLDVAEQIGAPCPEQDLAGFLVKADRYRDPRNLPDLGTGIKVSREDLAAVARIYLPAVRQAGRIYRHIEARKGAGAFVTEISMDEAERPQSTLDLALILVMVALEGIPAQTIAPKFPGRFNKGVDYVGDREQFQACFDQDLAVLAWAAETLPLPSNLKLSVHSGSDKFSLFGPMGAAIRRRGAGLHLKTAGTTWLEEVAGLAESGPEGLALAREIYAQAHARRDELTGPYLPVIAIDPARLPSVREVAGWDSGQFLAALRNDPAEPRYNPSFRQMVHVAYRVAAELGTRFTGALEAHADVIGAAVRTNIYDRHLKPLFLG
jgi:hypothetical protein